MCEYYRTNENLPQNPYYNEGYLLGNQVKSFLNDIYICDSEDIISLDDENIYTWDDIENKVREYEAEELKNV